MKVLLVQPPTGYDFPIAYRSESLGIGYIAAILRRDGHDVEVLDAHLRCIDTKTTITEIISRDFDCLGLTAALAHKDSFKSIVKAVRKARKDALIIGGGYLPTLAPEYLFKECPELDFVVRGEGETVVSDVFGRLERNEDWHDAPGIAYADGDKTIVNPLPPRIDELDLLPFPARDAVMQARGPVAPGIASSRGCYHRCSFCCVQSFYALSGSRAPRFRTPENVVDELESVVAETGLRHFRFVDDDFIGPNEKLRNRTMQMAQEIIKRNLKITFQVEFRADEVDADIILLLKEAGLNEIFLGVESGVQRQLDTYNKKTTVEQNKKAIEIVRSTGVKLRCGFIMFDPYITAAEIQENIQFTKDMELDVQAKSGFAPLITKLVLHRGVPLEEQLRKDGLLIEKGIDVDYKFKDPQAAMMLKMSLGLDSIARLFKGKLRQYRE